MKIDDFMTAVDNPNGTKQRRLFSKHKRGGIELTREQVAAIKVGRKKLRKELKARGIKDKKEFEVTAASMGLYFDKSRLGLLLGWLFFGRGVWALLGALLALLLALFLYATVTQLRGHFTINMSDGLFREGFSLSETADFESPTTHLFCDPIENVPCISISHIPGDVDNYDGQHNESYFAYTFYVRNEGESTVGYSWSLDYNSESNDLSEAVWVMVFEDGNMLFYAKPGEDGGIQSLPAKGDDTRGYVGAPLIEQSADPDKQYEMIAKKGNLEFYRVNPIAYVSDITVAQGRQGEVKPKDVHKYTIVIWLEGDDPDCTDEMIGGHAGMEMNLQLIEGDDETEGNSGLQSHWDAFWDNLKFWQD